MSDFSNLYSLRIDNLRKKEGAILKKIRIISFFRLLNFLAICFAFAISFTDGILFAIAGSLLVAIFIYLIRQYTQLSQGLAIIRILLKLNGSSWSCILRVRDYGIFLKHVLPSGFLSKQNQSVPKPVW